GTDFSRNPEKLADEILEMGCQIHNNIGLGLMLNCVGIASRRHQPGVKFGVGIGEVSDEGAIEPNEAIAVVKIGERNSVLEDEVGHQGSDIHRQAVLSPPALSLDRKRQIETATAIHRDSVASRA